MATAGALTLGLVAIGASPLLRLAVGVPLFFGLLGLVQAQLRFCVGFAMAGLCNFGTPGAGARVEYREERRSNLRRAVSVTFAVALGAATISLGLALLPL